MSYKSELQYNHIIGLTLQIYKMSEQTICSLFVVHKTMTNVTNDSIKFPILETISRVIKLEKLLHWNVKDTESLLSSFDLSQCMLYYTYSVLKSDTESCKSNKILNNYLCICVKTIPV